MKELLLTLLPIILAVLYFLYTLLCEVYRYHTDAEHRAYMNEKLQEKKLAIAEEKKRKKEEKELKKLLRAIHGLFSWF